MRASIEPILPDQDSSFRCFRRQEPNFPFQWHFHPEYELVLIEKGRGRRFVGDHIGDYTEGDLVLLGANVPHAWQSTETVNSDSRATVIQFLKESLGRAIWDLPELKQVAPILNRSRLGLRFTGPHAEMAADSLKQLPDLNVLERFAGFFRTLSHLAHCKQTETLVGPSYSPTLAICDSQRIDTLTTYLLENLQRHVPQREVAQRLHMSSSSFSRFCRRVLGRTFVEYAHELRLSEACRLLIETNRSVTQIAYQVGYNSLSNFSRRFQTYRGMTARAYRKNYTEQKNKPVQKRLSMRDESKRGRNTESSRKISTKPN